MDYITINNADIQTFELTRTALSNEKIIGTCELGTAEIQLINDSNEYSQYKNKWIRTPLGSLYINDIEPVQEKVNIKLSCYDIKYLLDVEYKITDFQSMFPCTIRAWRNAIFDSVGVRYVDEEFPNSEFVLPTHPYVDSNISKREVIKQIAEAGCSWVEVDNEDVFKFGWVNDTIHTITDWLELTTESNETNPINEVVLGRGVEDIEIYPPNPPENPHEFRIDNNYILDPQISDQEDRRPQVIQPIYNRVNGFKYIVYNIRTQDVEDILNIGLGDKISYIDIWGNQLSSIVMSATYKWLGGELNDSSNYEVTLSAEDIKETSSEYAYSRIGEKITQIGVYVDKQNAKIESIAAIADESGQKVSRVEQTVSELNSKISEVANVTVTKDTYIGQVKIDNVNASNPIAITIHPINESISYLYPFNGLYPSNTLYSKNRVLRFKNTKTNEIWDWLLPTDLWYVDEENYDEMYLSYEALNIKVTRRCEIKADGKIYVKNEETIETYSYPNNLDLTDGNYEITLLGYNAAYINATLMASNIYTSQFATKVEVSSEIKQTADSITASVEEKSREQDGKITNLSSRITQNANSISTEVNERKNGQDTLSSRITQNTSSITSEIKNRQDGEDALSSRIKQTADSLTSEISDRRTSDNALSTRISQTTKGISLSVNNGSTSSGITITTTKEDGTTSTATGTIEMNGLVKFSNLSDGTTTISGSNIKTGTIDASKVNVINVVAKSVAAENITGSTISGKTLSGGSININNKFRVSDAGAVTASNISVTGGSISLASNTSSPTFKVGTWRLTDAGLAQVESSNNYLMLNNQFGLQFSGAKTVQDVYGGKAVRILTPSGTKYLHFYHGIFQGIATSIHDGYTELK